MMKTEHLRLQGMSCAGCASTIERVINNVEGVSQGNVNFALSQATVSYDERITNLSNIQEAVNKSGYQAFPLSNSREDEDTEKKLREAEQKELTRKVIVGLIICLILIFVN